jgi:hypothetical protein
MLDTHYALEGEATETYEIDGRQIRFRPYTERGRRDVFSGMRPTSKSLRLEDIEGELPRGGFDRVDVVETRSVRNGPRALHFAEKTPSRTEAA